MVPSWCRARRVPMIWENSVQSPANTLAETKAKTSAPGTQLL